MSRKKMIVIGAGVSGLASAVRLLSEGFEVDLYEKNNQVGGRMGVISGNGFTFDLGPTILMMPQIYQEVFSSCGRKPGTPGATGSLCIGAGAQLKRRAPFLGR
ncbi:phytoene desaturase family protein [Acetobacterium sp.]|uniref:phytoene desaturase family protein n=1 Tax=Acetobacterium sp. TaxID=1872094 RepID=UPI00359304AB